MPPRSENFDVSASCERYVAYLFAGILICFGVASGQEKEPESAPPQQGVMVLIPADMEKHAEGTKLSKKEKRTADLIKKIKAIEKGGDVDATNKHRQTALMYAAASDNFLVVCWLVAKGADVELVSEKGKSALDYTTDARILKFLRFVNEHTAIPDQPTLLPFPARSAEYLALHVRFAPQTAEGAPALPMAADMTGEGLLLAIALQLPAGDLTPAQQFAAALLQGELPAAASLLRKHPRLLYEHGILRLLNQAGADVNVKDSEGRTLLHHFVNSPEHVEALIQVGAAVDATDKHGRTPLCLAENTDSIKLLARSGADVNAKDSAGQTLLHRFVNSPEHVEALIQVGAAVDATDEHGRTPLHLAENLDSIRLLADTGAKLNAPDDQGLSPLHLAANSPERVEALIRAGADVNTAAPSGKTPLHITTSARTVQLLLRAGAAIDAADKLGNTPLMAHAAMDDPDDVAAATALLDADADTTLLNKRGDSALKIALKNPKHRHLIIELFEQRHVTDIVLDPHIRDAQGRTALMLSVMEKQPHIPTIQKLLARGADVNALDRRGYSALMHLLVTSDDPELLSLLLDAGARIDLLGRDRKSPLLLAREFHRDASVKLLTEYNATRFDHIVSSVLPNVQFPEDYLSFRSRNDYPLTYDTWRDPVALSSPGKFLVVIDLSSQRGLFIVADRPAMDFPVCTGRGPKHATPTGLFRITEKDRHHRSNLYRSSMPFFMRLTNDGVGLHVGDVLRTPDSHGCVRMQHDACQTLFNLLPLGSEVVIRE